MHRSLLVAQRVRLASSSVPSERWPAMLVWNDTAARGLFVSNDIAANRRAAPAVNLQR